MEIILKTHDIDTYKPKPDVYIVRVWEEGEPIIEIGRDNLRQAMDMARQHLEAIRA
jgi:hypothetical protein